MSVALAFRLSRHRAEPQVETRVFSALASGLALPAQWLVGLRVTGAVMKVYNLLSKADLDVKVVNA